MHARWFARMMMVLLLYGVPAGLTAQTIPVLGNQVISGHVNYCEPATASGTTYACTLGYPLTTYGIGTEYSFKADVPNSGAAAINFNGIGVVSIKKLSGNITTDLAAGDLCAGQQVVVRYDGTNMQLVSKTCPAVTSSPDLAASYAWTGLHTHTQPLEAPVEDKGGAVYNITAYGGVGDGVTDNTAVLATIQGLATAGGILYFPPGRYRVSNVYSYRNGLTWRGAGMYASVLITTASDAPDYMIYQAGSSVAFEDLGFDGNLLQSQFIAEPPRAGTFRVERCRFSNFLNYALNLSNGNFLVRDSLFEGTGAQLGTLGLTGIALSNGVKRGEITGNIFRYLNNGITAGTGAAAAPNDRPITQIHVANNQFDLGWYTMLARASGSGGTVSYTATQLTDTGATFTALTYMAYEPVRIMPVRQTGTGTVNYTHVTDASAAFVTNGVMVGELIRLGGALGIIASVYDNNNLEVEEWLSETDRQRVAAPASGPYTVYRVILGHYASHTAQTITVTHWFDLQGTTITSIPAGTLYEILPGHGNYPLLCGRGCKHWTMTDNHFVRGWSEQIGYYGEYGQIQNNFCRDGMDAGITVQDGSYNVITGNRVHHNGAGGILAFSHDTLVASNLITDSRWTNNSDTNWLAGISVGGTRVLVANNVLRNDGAMPNNYYGIAVTSAGGYGGVSDVLLIGNTSRNHITASVRLDGATVTGTRLVNHISSGEALSSLNAATFAVDPLPSSTFATLGTPSNGVMFYCSDCTVAATCAGSGTGAIAKRLANAWVCN